MSISVLVPVSEADTPSKKTIILPVSYTTYFVDDPLAAGTFSLTSLVGSSNVYFKASDGTILLTQLSVGSTSVSVNLTSDVVGYYLLGTANSTSFSIEQTASLFDNFSALSGGTVDTITTTSTYNQTGLLYVVAFGGGAGGSTGFNPNQGNGPGGGGSGGVSSSFSYVNAAQSITIGNGGNSGQAGGGTSFGNVLSVNGGESSGNSSGGGGGGAGGSGGVNSASAGGVSTVSFKSVGNYTTGGGGGGTGSSGDNNIVGGAGGVGNIGTGGQGGGKNNQGTSGTGFASGGGAGGIQVWANVVNAAGSGRPGIVYVLRGF